MTILIRGLLSRHCSRTGRSGSATATATSSAWPAIYLTASGPNVSYSGTVTRLWRAQAASKSTHSGQLGP